jgi:hypothetical protein
MDWDSTNCPQSAAGIAYVFQTDNIREMSPVGHANTHACSIWLVAEGVCLPFLMKRKGEKKNFLCNTHNVTQQAASVNNRSQRTPHSKNQ